MHLPVHCSALDSVEDLARTRAWHHLRPRQHSFGRFVAERTEFCLDRDLHHQIIPRRDRTRPVLLANTNPRAPGDTATRVSTANPVPILVCEFIQLATAPPPSSSPVHPAGSNSSLQPSFRRSSLSACRKDGCR